MNILQIAYIFPPFLNVADGITHAAYQTSRELVKRGHEVVVYTSDALDVHSNARINDVGSATTINGVSVHYFRSLLKWGTLIVTPSIIPLLQENLNRFDIIHIHSCISFQGFLTSLFAKKNKAAYVLQAHGSVPRSQQRIIRYFYDRLFSFHMLRSASKLIALSHVEAEQYRNIGMPDEKIEIIPNGIDLSEYVNLPPKGSFRKKFCMGDDEKIVLYLGRIHKVKGIDILVEAFADVLGKLQGGKLVIVGPDDGYLGELERLTRVLKIKDSVLMLGPLYGTDKLGAYVDANVYVLPSRYETFPMSVLEAVACGTPVILTENCSVKEYFRDKVGLVVEADSDDLSQGLLEILLSERKQNAFRASSKTVIEGFDISKTVSELEKVYEQIAAIS